MDTVLTFLQQNRTRLDLARFGADAPLTSVILTPRFQASSHVVFLLISQHKATPVLVAKTPRLASATAAISREAANLQRVQALRPQGFASIPQVVAYEEHCGRPLLVETALVGKPMDPALVRQQRSQCCTAVVDWLLELQTPACDQVAHAAPIADWYAGLIAQPLRYLAEHFPLSASEEQLLQTTAALAEPLQTMSLPLPFEHGDVSHPNLFLLPNGSAGVVDWELALPVGLPACDLFFFLTYAAFAHAGAGEQGGHLEAFTEAFWGPTPWTKAFVPRYAAAMGLPRESLTPLFVLTWLRYLVGLLSRLADANGLAGRFDDETANWLRQNRYFALWQHAVKHANELTWAA
ncbi:MAG: aminoglycoside phosphotransferase family protein [Caldilineaceae bacterium]|nr:aminoglycoside phosphotransferase family protein [Caldilineaceae bacterium]